MNDLNSVLIEGTIFNDPVKTLESGKCIALMIKIESLSRAREMEHRTAITILMFDECARSNEPLLSYGNRIRIIGKLRNDTGPEGSELVVIAEHIEIKPGGEKR